MPHRRDFLQSLPALALKPKPKPSPASRDFFKELGVRPFINAAGTYTALTASLMPPEVMAAMQYASRHYVRLNELQDAVGGKIARLLEAEAAMVTSGAAGALTVATAACLTGTDRAAILRLPDLRGLKSEVLVQKSHRNGYDHAIRACGVKMVEVNTVAEVESAAGAQSALMFFFNDADQRGTIKVEEWARLGKKLSIPTLIDAAADVPPVENLARFVKMGYDLVAFSGGKGIRGPQSAGLLLGRKPLIEAARLNTSPNSDSIARGMKVNKEEMVGMLVALELYLKRDHAAERKEWDRRAEVIAQAAKAAKTVTSEVFVPPIANNVPHLRLKWDQQVVRISPPEVMKQLRDGDPSIEACPFTDKDSLVFGVWMMEPGDAETVAKRLRQILRSA